jgi:hypothetical protein
VLRQENESLREKEREKEKEKSELIKEIAYLRKENAKNIQKISIEEGKNFTGTKET